MRYLILAVPLFLFGCNSGPANQAQIQKMGNACQAYGFKPGTDLFAACVFRLDQSRMASNQQARMAVGQSMQAAGAAIANSSPPPRLYNHVRCTSSPGLNGTVKTRCR